MTTPGELLNLYNKGVNISSYLRKETGISYNSSDIIEISYDLQTGSYINSLKDKKVATQKEKYCNEIANTIRSLCNPKTILEAGVGEGTTLSGVIKNFTDKQNTKQSYYGFDLSWSRVLYAKKWLHNQGINNTFLCTGNLFNIPFTDNYFDIVYTSHSIEPNGGNEEPILQELYRVTKNFLILLEPGYDFANNEARKRMEFHGYCKDLQKKSISLGYDVQEHKLFPHSSNKMNPTAITIIRKRDTGNACNSTPMACPKFKTPLKKMHGMLYSPEALVVYPIIGDIPCLRIENGIIASKFEELLDPLNE